MPSNVDQLVTQFSADITKFEAAMKKMVAANDEAQTKVEKRHKEANEGIAQLWGKSNVGEALNNVFKSTRLGVIEEGATKIPVFGSALEALGPAGFAAAAGLAAVGAAMEFAHKAAEYAEDIEKMAAKLGVTTTALQQYDFIALKTGATTQEFRDAILKGSEAFGAFLSNVGDTKTKQAFAAIGITKDQARDLGSFQNALPVIADHIKELGNSAEQAQIAKKLGLEAMLPALRQGSAGLSSMAREAKELGIVLDENMIKQGAKAAEQMKVAADVVEKNLTRAFISLAPVVAAITEKVAALARYIADVAESFKSLDHQSQGYIDRESKRQQSGVDTDKRVAEFFGAKQNADGTVSGGLLSTPGGLVDSINARVARIAEMHKRSADMTLDDEIAAKEAGGGPGKALVAEKAAKAKKGPEDETDSLNTSSDEALDAAKKSVADAYRALAVDIEAKADLEKQSVDDDTDKKLAALQKQRLAIEQSKNDKAKAEQEAKIDAAMTQVKLAAELKKSLIDQQTTNALTEQNIAFQDKINSMMSNIADMDASMATTAAERNAIEAKNLRDNQARERIDQEARWKDQIDANNALKANGDKGYDAGLDERIAEERKVYTDQQQTAQTQQKYNQANPVEQWSRSLSDVQTQLQQIEVKGLQGLTDGITDAIMHTKKLGDAFHEISLSILSDLVKIGVEQMITRPLAGMLFGGFGGLSFGHAAGTDSSPGGIGLVGESGPELVALPQGSQVLPNNLLRNMTQVQGGGVNQANYNLTTVVNANDAVLTSTVQAWITAAHQSAVATATQASTRSIAMANRNGLR